MSKKIAVWTSGADGAPPQLQGSVKATNFFEACATLFPEQIAKLEDGTMDLSEDGRPQIKLPGGEKMELFESEEEAGKKPEPTTAVEGGAKQHSGSDVANTNTSIGSESLQSSTTGTQSQQLGEGAAKGEQGGGELPGKPPLKDEHHTEAGTQQTQKENLGAGPGPETAQGNPPPTTNEDQKGDQQQEQQQ